MSKLEELIKEYCPNGVEYAKIGDICDISRGQVMSKDFIRDNSGEYPVYSSQTENEGVLGKISTYMFDGEYLTWTTDGANAGMVFYRKGKFSVTNVCGLLKVASKNVFPKFLYYALSVVTSKYVNKGMGNPKLMSNVMARIQIPLPALPVQREIVRVLDSFTLYSAELTAELTARRKQYEFYRDKLLTFEQPEVKQIPLGKLAKFTYGYTDVAKDVGDARFIRITDINEDGCLSSGNCKYITLNDESKKYLLKEGDLLLARTGATYGKTLYFPNNEPAVYASFLIKIDLDNSVILNRYYWHFSKSNLYWKQADKYVSKAGQQQFNTNAVSRVIVPVPSIEVQERIVKVLDNFDEICSDLKIGLPAEMEKRQQQYEYYRDKLLTFDTKSATIFRQTDRQTDRQTGLIRLLQYVYGFAFVELESVLRIRNGKDYKHLGSGDIPVYGSGGIMAQVNTCIYDKPTVLIPRKGSIDKLYYTEKPFWNVDTIFYTEIDENFTIAKYIYYCLQKEHLEDYNTAGGVPSLTQTVLNKIVIPLPTLEKQKEIVDILDRFDNLCNDISKGLPAEIEARQKQYEFYRDKLLNFKDIEEDGEKETKAKGTGKN